MIVVVATENTTIVHPGMLELYREEHPSEEPEPEDLDEGWSWWDEYMEGKSASSKRVAYRHLLGLRS